MRAFARVVVWCVVVAAFAAQGFAECGTIPIVSPPNGSSSVPPNAAGTVTLKWQAVTGATSYDVYFGTPGQACTANAPHATVNAPTTEWSPPSNEISRGATYEWKVKANGPVCPAPPQTICATFTVTGCPSAPPALTSPANNTEVPFGAITFQWNSVANATGYEFFLAIDGGSFVSVGVTTNAPQKQIILGPGHSFEWYVVTVSGQCTPQASQHFKLTTSCPTGAPTLHSPDSGSVFTAGTDIQLSWSGVTGATAYTIEASPKGRDLWQGIATTQSTSTSLTKAFTEGEWDWRVRAVFQGTCTPATSTPRSFTVKPKEEDCGNATIVLKTPTENASTTSPVRLSWTGVAGTAIVYRVWVSVDDAAPVNLTRTNATEATLSLPSGKIRWYVDVPRVTCPTIVSNEGHFTVAKIATCASNAAPTLVAPVGTEQQPAHAASPVTLVWNTTPNAIGYRVWLAQKTNAFEDLELTRETQLKLDLGPGTYRWFVQAFFEGCDPTASPVAFFDVAVTTNRCPTAAPTIIEPAANATVHSPVTISWSAVADAKKYRLFASRDGEAPVLIGATSETTLERVLPPGLYVIAIEATFEECPSTVSERRSFTVARAQNCSGAAVELFSPGAGDSVSDSPVPFFWKPVTGAVKYVLFIQAGDGAPTAVESTDQTTVTHAVPPGRVTWWIVTFFAGCDPTESAHNTFTFERPQNDCGNARPILLLPSDDAPAVFSPVHFAWTAVPNATGYTYSIWVPQGSPATGIVETTTDTEAVAELAPGAYRWIVQATFANCRPRESAVGEFVVRAPLECGRPAAPEAQVVGQAQSNTKYRVRWTPLPNVDLYELQESTSADFTNATTFTLSSIAKQFSHEVTGAPVQYLYRVRGVSKCNDQRGAYSDVAGVFIIAPKTNNASAEVGAADNVVQTLFLPGSTAPLHFTATADKPWITITPSSGTLPVEGITLTIAANPGVLNLGTNTATINVSYSAASAGSVRTNGVTLSTIPVSVSLVTPVTPTGSSAPPPDALIFPVVGHAAGANDSLFETDIRVTNLTAQPMKYQLKFTPSGTDGTVTGSSSNVQIEPNQTLALDDIVSSLFGTGTIGSATGMLEVRPLTTSTSSTGSLFSSVASGLKPLNTAASSRTYNFTPTGTFGQFIPAVRFDEFVGKALSGPSPILSLQQVAQSADYRANFGFAEGSGQPADLMVRVYDTASALLQSIPVSLQAGEHKQLNGMLALNGITDLANGRVEVEVVGGNGKVTAYVSEIDNRTNDPLLVSAAVKGDTTSNRYVVPGVAYINSGFAFWVTDLRIFNAGTTSTPATLTFYPQGSPGAAVTRDITLAAGEIKVLDNVVGGLFAQPNGAGGSIAISTPTSTKLTATARTYNQTSNGTYGQYIAGVTPAQSVGVNDRALQLLQLEQSSRFRTNIGLDETSGQPVRVEVALIVPDSIATPVVTYDLAANEFRQFSLADFNLGSAIYNARVTVKVVSGTGRVTAYGSAIDLTTQDPTYVPAQ